MKGQKLGTKLLRNTMIKTVTRLEFKDTAIDKIKGQDLEFSSQGKTKLKDRIYIPFNVTKKSSLKGLKLCVHRSTGNRYFVVIFWFKKKQKIYSVGKFIPGIFGTKQVEEKLFPVVKEHTNEKGIWIKDPNITERDKTRVITDTQFTDSKKKTINEIIVACLKADLPKGKHAGRLRAISAQDLSRYMIGYNWRHKHLVFRDDKDGNGYITFKPNWRKRTARPQDWEDLFTRYGPGIGNIKSEDLNPMKAKSIYDSPLGKTIIDDLNEGIIKRYLAG